MPRKAGSRYEIDHHITNHAIGFAWDGGELSWAPERAREHHEYDSFMIDGGFVFGLPEAVEELKAALCLAPTEVRLTHNEFYTFTEDRAVSPTLPDMLAAMVYVGRQRGSFDSDTAWNILRQSEGYTAYDPEPVPGSLMDAADVVGDADLEVEDTDADKDADADRSAVVQ